MISISDLASYPTWIKWYGVILLLFAVVYMAILIFNYPNKTTKEKEEIKNELSSRHLTSKQKEILISQLKAFPSSLSVTWQPGDISAAILADDISSALKEAKWKIEKSQLMWAPDKVRFDISVSRTENGDSKRLKEALSLIGIPVELDAPKKHFTLFIGNNQTMK